MKNLVRDLWPEALGALLVFWRLNDDSLNSLYSTRWGVLLLGCALLFARNLERKFRGSGIITWAVLLSGINILLFRTFTTEPLGVQLALRAAVAQGTLTALLAIYAAAYLPFRVVRGIGSGVTLSGLSYAGLLLVRWVTGQDVTHHVPFFDNPSMAASFVVLCLLVFDGVWSDFKQPLLRGLLWALGLGAVLLTRTSTPLLALVAGWGARLLLMKPKERESFCKVGVLVTPVLVAVLLYLDPVHTWISDNSRFWIWGKAFHYWLQSGHILTGLGTGITRVLFPLLQITENTNTSVMYLWLHNDWLQTLFEQGVLGFLALLYFAWCVMWRLRRTQHIFSAMAGFGAVMLTGFPFHWVPHVVFALVACRYAYESEHL